MQCAIISYAGQYILMDTFINCYIFIYIPHGLTDIYFLLELVMVSQTVLYITLITAVCTILSNCMM